MAVRHALSRACSRQAGSLTERAFCLGLLVIDQPTTVFAAPWAIILGRRGGTGIFCGESTDRLRASNSWRT